VQRAMPPSRYQMPKRPSSSPTPPNASLLERILDKGVVVIGDIRIALADIELLRIQLRLLIMSVEKAKGAGARSVLGAGNHGALSRNEEPAVRREERQWTKAHLALNRRATKKRKNDSQLYGYRS
jgi:hypothetical protein